MYHLLRPVLDSYADSHLSPTIHVKIQLAGALVSTPPLTGQQHRAGLLRH